MHMTPLTISLLVIASVLISALDKALTEDVRVFPVLSAPVRALIAAVGGVVVGSLDARVGGALFLPALLSGISVAAPTLIRLLLVALLPSAEFKASPSPSEVVQ